MLWTMAMTWSVVVLVYVVGMIATAGIFYAAYELSIESEPAWKKVLITLLYILVVACWPITWTSKLFLAPWRD